MALARPHYLRCISIDNPEAPFPRRYEKIDPNNVEERRRHMDAWIVWMYGQSMAKVDDFRCKMQDKIFVCAIRDREWTLTPACNYARVDYNLWTFFAQSHSGDDISGQPEYPWTVPHLDQTSIPAPFLPYEAWKARYIFPCLECADPGEAGDVTVDRALAALGYGDVDERIAVPSFKAINMVSRE